MRLPIERLGHVCAPYLRNEACSNNLADFGLKKGLDHLAAVRERLLAVTANCATRLIHDAI